MKSLAIITAAAISLASAVSANTTTDHSTTLSCKAEGFSMVVSADTVNGKLFSTGHGIFDNVKVNKHSIRGSKVVSQGELLTFTKELAVNRIDLRFGYTEKYTNAGKPADNYNTKHVGTCEILKAQF